MENELPLLRVVIAGGLGSMLGGLILASIKQGKGEIGMPGWIVWTGLLIAFGVVTQHKILRGFFQPATPKPSLTDTEISVKR